MAEPASVQLVTAVRRTVANAMCNIKRSGEGLAMAATILPSTGAPGSLQSTAELRDVTLV